MPARREPRLVGRADEQRAIREAIARAGSEGRGAAIAISGGPGLGKSSLLAAAARLARGSGLRVVRGRGGGDWASAGLAQQLLGAQPGRAPVVGPPPKVEALYLMTRSGLLLESRERGDTGVDADIFTGMLTAVSEFLKDSFTKLGREGEEFESIALGSRAVVAQSLRRLSAAAMLSGAPAPELREDLKSLLETAWAEYEGAAGARERWVPLSTVGVEMNRMMERWDGRRAGAAAGIEDLKAHLERLCRRGPVLACVDEAESLDERGRETLTWLAGRSAVSPLVVLAAFRAGADGLSTREVQEWGFRALPLRPLDPPGVAALIGEEIDSRRRTARISSGLRDEIHRASGGVPLRALGLARALVRSRALRRNLGGWELDPRGGRGRRELESALRKGLVEGALASLSPDDHEMLDIAAAAGEEIEVALVAAVLGKDEAHVARAARRVEEVGGVVVRWEEGHRFAHPAVRETVYAAIPAKIRKEYHRGIASALRAMPARDRSVEESAFHLWKSGARLRASHDLIEAGREAASVGRWQEARRLLALGTRCLGEVGGSPRERLLAEGELARALLETGEHGEVVELLAGPRAPSAARDPTRAVILCEALLELDRPQEALEVAEAAIPRASEDVRPALAVARVEALVAAGEFEEVAALSSSLLTEISLRDPGPETSARLYLSVGSAISAGGGSSSGDAEAMLRRASDLGEIAGALRVSARADLSLARLEMAGGAMLQARESLRSAMDRADRVRDLATLFKSAPLLVPLELVFGTLGEAERATRTWVARVTPTPPHGAIADVWHGLVRWLRGASAADPGDRFDGSDASLPGRWLRLHRSPAAGRFAPASLLAERIVDALRSPSDDPAEAQATSIVALLAALDVGERTWGLAPGSFPLAEELGLAIGAGGEKRRAPAWERSLLSSLVALERLRQGDADRATRAAEEAVSTAGSAGSTMLRGRALRVLAATRLAEGRNGPGLEAARASGRVLRSCGALGEAWVSAMVEVEALLASGSAAEAARIERAVPKERRSTPVTVSGLGGSRRK